MRAVKVSGGEICGVKEQSSTFVPTAGTRGSYPMYVCSIVVEPGKAHKGEHYDGVLKVKF